MTVLGKKQAHSSNKLHRVREVQNWTKDSERRAAPRGGWKHTHGSTYFWKIFYSIPLVIPIRFSLTGYLFVLSLVDNEVGSRRTVGATGSSHGRRCVGRRQVRASTGGAKSRMIVLQEAQARLPQRNMHRTWKPRTGPEARGHPSHPQRWRSRWAPARNCPWGTEAPDDPRNWRPRLRHL